MDKDKQIEKLLNDARRPQVGVGVYVLNDKNEILLGKRRGFGAGNWGAPGGHLEFGETFRVCAERETMEECGIEIDYIDEIGIANEIFPNGGRHYVTVSVVAKYRGGSVTVKEPDKMENWEWFNINELPRPMQFDTKHIKKYLGAK